MTHPVRRLRPISAAMAGALTAAALALAGCATSQVNAQWSDPQFAGKSLRGATVLVACQAADLTLRRVCAERSAAKLAALGAVPVLAPDSDAAAAAGTVSDNTALLQAARSAGAVALLNTTVAPDAAVASPGPSIGIGIGGFGGGYRSGGGVGFGVSAPIGGASVQTGYSANASLTDVASGQLMWSARASAAPSSDVGQQLSALAALLLDSARQAGYFPA